MANCKFFSRTIVIPYFDEISRFPIHVFIQHTKKLNDVEFILVDDGSSDKLSEEIQTQIEIQKLQNIHIIVHDKNYGKAQALNTGMLFGIAQNSDQIGFMDADFSSSIAELMRLFNILSSTDSDAVIGSRKSNDYNNIESKFHRWLAGRLFSVFIRIYLHINIVDTQCGAKVFKVNNLFLESLKQPVINPWLYDLQLLLPIIKSGGIVTEISLNNWKNGPRSKFNLSMGLQAFFSLKKIKNSSRFALKKV
jgi:dolichyl-phosphate beta-glucosyltransferase